jgi:MIP family channel proteins
MSQRRLHDNDEFAAAPGARRLLAELVGTFALTSVAAGADTTARLSGGDIDVVARSLAPALLVMAFIYALGDASGAHFNPAVSLGFTLRGLFPARWMAQYWLAQASGALLAGAGLVLLFGGPVAEAGVDTPHVPAPTALVLEIFLSWVLLTVILGTADRHRLVGPNAALAVAGAISLCGLGAKVISGASMNPARSLGPALATGKIGDLWIYLSAPFIGALLAVLFTRLIHGSQPRDREQVKAATGEQPDGAGG